MDYSFKEDAIEHLFEKVKNFFASSKSIEYRLKFLQSNALVYCVVLLLVFKIATVAISINLPHNIFFADITKSALESFANQTRQSLGLKPLLENSKLNQAAQLKAENMLQNQYFSHNSPTGVTPWFWFLKAGYNYKYAGENLAIGFYDSEEVYNAWLNSPSHKANILNAKYTEVGTAVVKGFGQNNTIIVVQEFGSQLPVKPAATKPVTTKPVAVQSAASNKASEAISQRVEDNNERVLSQTTESQGSIESLGTNGANNLPSKVVSSVIYNYDEILQKIIYGVSLVVIGVLLTLIFFNAKFGFKKELVFRAAVVLILLSLAAATDRNLIISIIPHQVII